MIKKNQTLQILINSFTLLLIFTIGFYLMAKYQIKNGRALLPVLLPIIIILQHFKIVRFKMILTTKEVIVYLMTLYTGLIFYLFFNNLSEHKDYSFSMALLDLLKIYFYPLIFFVLPPLIVFGVPYMILHRKTKL